MISWRELRILDMVARPHPPSTYGKV